jgi:hypothetical protein
MESGMPENNRRVEALILIRNVGSAAFYWGYWWYELIKDKNMGHAYFSFQKIAMPITPLIILSIIFYFLSKQA